MTWLSIWVLRSLKRNLKRGNDVANIGTRN